MSKRILYLIVLAVIILAVALKSADNIKYSQSGNGMDVWEYQTVAVNFAQDNRFPVMGFLDDEDTYELNKLQSNPIEDYYMCRFTNHGPVTYVGKPPLYSFTLGVFYKIFHPDLKNAYYLNLIFLAGILMVLLLIGYFLDREKGFLIGLAAAVIYIMYGKQGLSDILPATMLTFICCCIALLSVLILKFYSPKYFLAMGVFIGAGMLTKGNIIFMAFLTPLTLFYLFWGRETIISKLALLYLSSFLILIPWIIYGNVLRINSQAEWTEWKNKIIKAENACELDTTKIQDWGLRENRRTIVRNNEHHKIVSHLYTRTANEHVPIIISNQATADEELSVHCEYNIDGDWHPEWRFRKTSIYNTMYLDQPYLFKMISFYIDNPSLIFKIAHAKLVRTTSLKFSLFLTASFLFGCMLWLSKINSQKLFLKIAFLFGSLMTFIFSLFYFPHFHIIYSTLFFFSALFVYRKQEMNLISFIFPVSILNCFLTVIIFYGDSRFVNVIDPLSVFSSLYCIFLIVKSFFMNDQELQPSVTV
jgi:4-amino-4-deoxy-L-arabinose transferase-like glycosyltransferase